MDQQQTAQSRQDSLVDVSQVTEKPERQQKNKNTKSNRRKQQDPKSPPATNKLKAEASDPAEDIVTSPLAATNNAAEPATAAAGANFVADPEPLPNGSAFLCKFTLSRPGLVGLNKLAIYLNDLQDAGSISSWQARGWEDAATKVRALIGFATRADAITAIRSAQ